MSFPSCKKTFLYLYGGANKARRWGTSSTMARTRGGSTVRCGRGGTSFHLVSRKRRLLFCLYIDHERWLPRRHSGVEPCDGMRTGNGRHGTTLGGGMSAAVVVLHSSSLSRKARLGTVVCYSGSYSIIPTLIPE